MGEFDESLGGYAIEAWGGPGEGTETILATDFLTYQTPGSHPSPPFAEYTSGLTAIWAKTDWGYILEPPALPKEIREFDEVLSITPFMTEFPDGGPSNDMNSDDYLPPEPQLFVEPEQGESNDVGAGENEAACAHLRRNCWL